MSKILITGATGNIGTEVVECLSALENKPEVILAVRNIESTKKRHSNLATFNFRQFDFENEANFTEAFEDIQTLFLLRPPHISEIEKYFLPLLTAAESSGVKNIVFLSVQGAEKSKVIPHNKIEKLIEKMDFNYIFVRPSYFMQNLTTALLPEIQKNKSITLPSGKAKFNWIDTKNIGEAIAVLITSFNQYKNKAYEITGTENLNFYELSALMTDLLGVEYTFKNINPISFYFRKRKEGVVSGFAIVMTILHFLPRLQDEPVISDNFRMLTGRHPNTISDFILREKVQLVNK